ncbi:MAG: hypothetical protein QM756_08465 [Polyangiaceae bacterium]
MKSSLKAIWSWLRAGGALVGVIAGCREESEYCLLYWCGSSVRLTGTVQVSDGVQSVDATYCSPTRCIEKLIDVRVLPTACPQVYQDEICLVHPASGGLSVDASYFHEHDDWPIVETFTFTLVDHATGESLIDQSYMAHNVISREDNCHRCSDASITIRP